MTRAAFAAGAPAPEVFDEVTLEGRFGVVLQRLDGPTLLQLLRSGAMTPEQTGAILATVAISVHKIPPPPDVLSLRDLMNGSSRLSAMLPKHIATGILTLIEHLAPGDGLCHGDLYPGNVIMTADGPKLIDWGGRPARPPASTLRGAMSFYPSWKASAIRSGRAQSMRPWSPSTRGWPASPPRR
jgi:serine/threonine protein kinase